MDDKLLKTQKLLKYILNLFHTYCEENHLKYYLAYGSLLGAVRHKDIIPWDDDVDIYMFRDEYNKLRQIWKTNAPSELYLQSFDDVSDIYFTYAKLRLNGTVYNEDTTLKVKMHKGVFIDLFILDYLPNDPKELKKLHKAMNKINKLTYYKGMFVNSGIIKYAFTKFISYSHLRNKRNKLIERIKDRDLVGYIGSFSRFDHNIFKVEWFNERIKSNFGEYQFFIPIGYDNILHRLYDDYMKLPPKEQQAAPHVIDIDFGPYEDKI